MCQRKEPSISIWQYAEDVLVRIVYASYSDFVYKYLEYFKNNFPESSFRERVLTQQEESILDVDYIACTLSNTLEDVLKEKVYILNTTIEGSKVIIYIGKQYLAVQIKLGGNTISDSILASLSTMLNTNSIKDNIEIVDARCSISLSMVASDEDSLNSTLDLAMFKGVDADIKNSRYSDLYQNPEGKSIELTRELRDVILENDESAVFANILCSTALIIENVDSIEALKTGLNTIVCETTQCFR